MRKGCIYLMLNNQIFFSEEVVKDTLGVEFETDKTAILVLSRNKDDGKVSVEIIPAINMTFGPSRVFVPYTSISQIIDACDSELENIRKGLHGMVTPPVVEEQPTKEECEEALEGLTAPEELSREDMDRAAFLSKRE